MPKIVREFKNLSEAINAYRYKLKCGIYSFQSKRGKHIYVGMSHNFGTRFIEHRKSYRNKHGEHRKLHEYFDKVGFDKTPVKILFEASPAKFNPKELFVIESLFVETYLRHGYNLLNHPVAHRSTFLHYKKIGIKKYTRKGDFLMGYKSIYDLIEPYGFNVPNILRCCKGQIKTFKGYRWAIDSRSPVFFNLLKDEELDGKELEFFDYIYNQVVARDSNMALSFYLNYYFPRNGKGKNYHHNHFTK